jgi:hypothetical protein
MTTALLLFECPWLSSSDFDLKSEYYDNDELLTIDSYKNKVIPLIGKFMSGELYKEMHREWFRDQVSFVFKE